MRFVETLMKKLMNTKFDDDKETMLFTSSSSTYRVVRVSDRGVYYRQFMVDKNYGENLLSKNDYSNILIKNISINRAILGGHRIVITT